MLKAQEKHEKINSTLSWRAQNELSSLCGDNLLKKILEERKEALGFCDATPDVSKTEQNVLILRYISFNNEENKWEIHERFLEYFDLQVMPLVMLSIQVFNKHKIDFIIAVVSALIMDQIWLGK